MERVGTKAKESRHQVSWLTVIFAVWLLIFAIAAGVLLGKLRHGIETRDALAEQYQAMVSATDHEHSIADMKILALETEIQKLKEHIDEIGVLQPVLSLLGPDDLTLILDQLTPSNPFDSGFRVTSRFGEGPGHSGNYRGSHQGNDLVPSGDWYVRGMWEGEVVEIAIDKWYGKYILLEHSSRVRTRYAHLETIYYAADVGEHIDQGEIMGLMGSTGYSSGAHLHIQLEIFDGEKWVPVDIYPWLNRQ